MKVSVRSRRKGLRGLSRGLDDSEAINEALRAGAEEVAAEARSSMARDGGRGTRSLAESLEVLRGVRRLSYRVVSHAPRAWPREFGSLSRAQQPWLRPALDRARSGIIGRVRQALRRVVTRH